MARKQNAGWFRCGTDPRRHQLTTEERKRGYATTMNGGRDGQLSISEIAWFWRRVRSYYRALRRQRYQQ